MKEAIRVVVAFNDPSAAMAQEAKPLSVAPDGRLLSEKNVSRAVDLSEIGVLEEMHAITDALTAEGYETISLPATDDVEKIIRDLRRSRPAVVFNLVESLRSESLGEMYMAGLYELLGIVYTGSPPLALGIALHKWRAKEVLSYHRIPTPRFMRVPAGEALVGAPKLSFPLIVKPSREDASTGIDEHAVVRNFKELSARVRFVHENFLEPAIVEEYIEGREFNVAIVGDRELTVLPISEIDFSEMPDYLPHIVTYESKWVPASEAFVKAKPVCPAPIPATVERKAKKIALDAYRAVGCRDYARVDIRMDAEGRLYVIEVNPNPDISRDAGFIRSARAHGWTFEETVKRIVELALARARR